MLLVGTRAGGMTTGNWHVPAEGARVIQIDIDPQEIGRNYPVEVALVGDANKTLAALLAEIDRVATDPFWTRHAQQMVADWRQGVSPALQSDATPMHPARICRELSEALPERALVVSDTGHAAVWTGTMLDLKEGQRYIRCAGTLGWAFPAAIGAQCAVPDRQVVCFTGDGGFYYHLAELETAARFGINLVVVVNNNSALQQVRRGYDAAYGGTQRGRSKEMWVFRPAINLARIAEEMGWLGIQVEDPKRLRGALEEAFAAGRPTLIDAVSDADAHPPVG